MITTVYPRIRLRAWQGSLPCTLPTYPCVPLRQALEAAYPSDACMVCYGTKEGDQLPRLGKAALAHYMLHPDNAPKLTVAPVDIDYMDHEVPPDDWHESVLAKLPDDWPCAWYRTPHGMRLVFIPRSPVALQHADAYLALLHERLAGFGIETDAGTAQWTRFFKLPRALRRDLPMDLTDLGAPVMWHPEDLEAETPNRIGAIVNTSPVRAAQITKAMVKGLGELGEQIYHGRLSAPVGHRHATLVSAAAQIVAVRKTVDPRIPFELLADSADRMGKSVEELWSICEWTCAQQAGANEANKEAKKELTAELEEKLGDVVLLADTGTEYYVLDEASGQYHGGYTKQYQLEHALQEHCPILSSGLPQDDMTKVLARAGRVVEEIVYTYGDREGVEGRRLYLPACRPDGTIVPRFDADVQAWLDALFAPELERCLDWLAASTQTDRPICVLYLDGPPSIGKALLVHGLSRIWNPESQYVRYEELYADFNPGLLRSPIVYADEKVPQDKWRKNDSSTLRRFVANGVLEVNRKYRAPVTLKGYPRIIVTANNPDALGIREDLSPEDIDAIRIRVGYVNTDDKARKVLQAIAERRGLSSVTDFGNRWIQDGIIASHILWLTQNRDVNPGHRMVVEGWESELTRDLPLSVGSSGNLLNAITQAVIDETYYGNAVRFFDGAVYVNSNALAAQWREIIGNDVDRPPRQYPRNIALKTLAQERTKKLRVGNRYQRYWVLDPELVGRYAERQNLATREEIVALASRKTEEQPVHMEDFDEITMQAGATQNAKRGL